MGWMPGLNIDRETSTYLLSKNTLEKFLLQTNTQEQDFEIIILEVNLLCK